MGMREEMPRQVHGHTSRRARRGVSFSQVNRGRSNAEPVYSFVYQRSRRGPNERILADPDTIRPFAANYPQIHSPDRSRFGPVAYPNHPA